MRQPNPWPFAYCDIYSEPWPRVDDFTLDDIDGNVSVKAAAAAAGSYDPMYF